MITRLRLQRNASAPSSAVPRLRVADGPDGDGRAYLGRKAGCCLAYQCAVEDEPNPTTLTERERAYRARFPRRPDEPRYCSTCSLRDLAGCEEHQRFWLEQERATRPG